MARAIGCAVLAGLKIVTLYGLHDTGISTTDPEQSFGLYRHDLTPKPAAAAFRAMMDALAGAITYDAIADGPAYVITIRKAASVVKIVWTDAVVPFNYVVPMNAISGVRDAAGNSTWYANNPSGIMVQLNSAEAPVIVTGT